MAHSKSPWKSPGTDYDLMVNMFQFDRAEFLSTCKDVHLDIAESNYNNAFSITLPFKDTVGGVVVNGLKTNIIPLVDWELAKWMFATISMANPVYEATFCMKNRRVATFESLRGVYGALSVMSGKSENFDLPEENVRSRLIWESLPEAVFSEFYGRACVATDIVYRRYVTPTDQTVAVATPVVPKKKHPADEEDDNLPF
jgi:hypothetical protein